MPSPGPKGTVLTSVAATSASNAWAVGISSCGCGPGISLIEHWNGTAWARVPSPTPGGGVFLNSVTPISASRAWTVGATGGGDGPTKTLILQWNGTTWTQVPSPSPRASANLLGVAVVSSRNALAVGLSTTKHHTRPETLTLQWNGTAWK